MHANYLIEEKKILLVLVHLMFCWEFRVNVLLLLLLSRSLFLFTSSLSFFLCYFLIKICCGVVVFIPSTFFFALLSSLSIIFLFFSFSLRLFSTQNPSNGFSLDRFIHVTTHFFFRSFIRLFIRSVSLSCDIYHFT